LRAPEPLADHHNFDDFDSGTASLDIWLKRRSQGNQASGASRTFIVSEDEKIIAYYALASGAIGAAGAPGRFRRNMPDPIPVVVLARLAVTRSFQGRGLGRVLIRDAALRVTQAAETIGIRGIIVHAISAEAKAFYVAVGFDESPLEPMTLMMTISDIRTLLA
jgi:GNAT superfamily N-acetyltransferase